MTLWEPAMRAKKSVANAALFQIPDNKTRACAPVFIARTAGSYRFTKCIRESGGTMAYLILFRHMRRIRVKENFLL